MKDKQQLLLLDWMRKIHQNEYAHRFQSTSWSNVHYLLGVTSLLGGTIIAALSSFCEFEGTYKNSIIAIVGLLIAICSGLITFLKPQEASEKHKHTSSRYEQLRHRTEFLLTFEDDDDKLKEKVEALKQDWDEIDSLNVWEYIFTKAKKKVNSFDKYPTELSFISNDES
jgi:uncharacterized membrane protein YgaE (UPF0421/DUF939 family)